MAKKISFNLSVDSIQKAIDEVEKYKQRLISKNDEFVRRLAEVGIVVAQGNTGGFGKYISFSIRTENSSNVCKAVLVATNTGVIKSEWKTKDGVKTADVSPLLMAEFGSGLMAQNPLNVPGVGTGTFPGGTHGGDPNGWWWMDMDDVWHHSYGVTPTMPMYKASMEIMQKVREIAKQVFSS